MLSLSRNREFGVASSFFNINIPRSVRNAKSRTATVSTVARPSVHSFVTLTLGYELGYLDS